MRIVGIVAFFVILGCLWGGVSSRAIRREHLMTLLGVSFFIGGFLKTDVSFYGWPMWASPDRGYVVGLSDVVAIVLLGTRYRRPRVSWVKFLFVAHAAAIILSIAISSVPIASSFALWNFGRASLLFFAVAGEAHDRRMLGFLFRGLAFGLMLEAGTVIFQKLHGAVQAAGTFSHQNLLAVITELTLMPLLALFLEGGRQKYLGVGVLAALIVLAGGGSRAGLGLAALGIALTLALSAAHSMTARKSGLLVATALLVGVAVPVASWTLSKRFGSNSVFTTEDARDALERSARAMAADHPFGVGAGMFVTTGNTQGYTSRAGVSWGGGTTAAPVHNAYLLERAELGFLGLATYCSLLLLPMIAGFRAAFQRPRTPASGILTGAVAALAVLSLHSFFEYAPVTFECMGLLALNIAIIGGYRRGQSASYSKRPGAVPSNRANLTPAVDLRTSDRNGDGQVRGA